MRLQLLQFNLFQLYYLLILSPLNYLYSENPSEAGFGDKCFSNLLLTNFKLPQDAHPPIS